MTRRGVPFSLFAIDMAKVHPLRRLSTLALRQRRDHLVRQLHLPRHLLRASVVERLVTCGKPNCACTRGEKHGPFYFFTQCLGVGRTTKFLLKTPAALEDARAGTAAFNQFYDGLEELSQINAELLRRGERLPRD